MVKILHGNINHCKLAQELMIQLAYEQKTDIFIIYEQYQHEVPIRKNWFSDPSFTAAI